MSELLTVKEIAEYLKLHPKSVYKLSKKGEIPCIKIKGLGLRFKEEDIEKWLTKSSKQASKVLESFPKFKPKIEDYDKIFLKGEGALSKKSSKYWNYKGIGAVYVKGKTKQGKESWYMWYYNEENKRKLEHIKTATCRQDAVIALIQRVNEVRERKYGNENEKKKIRFDKFVPIYLENYAKLKKKSWKSDQKYIRNQLAPFFGEMELSEITSLHVSKFMKKRQSDGVKGSSINRELIVLKKMLSLAIEWEFKIEKNPVKKGNFFSEEQNRRKRVLSGEEEEKLLNEAALHLKPIIKCALQTGMRLQEILGLQVDDIDFSRDVIIIRPENNKTGKQDVIPIASRMKELLERLLEENKGRSKNVFNYTDPITGELKPIVTIRRSFNSACRRAGLNNLQFRDLRRTFSTRLHEKEIDPLVIQRLLRHSSFKISEEVYIQSNIRQMKRAIEMLDEKSDAEVKNLEDLLPICYLKDDEKGKKLKNVLFSTN